MKYKHLTIKQFLRRLAAWHKEHPRIKWTITDDHFIATNCREPACPITAIAWSRPRSRAFFADGANVLKLSITDSTTIINAADAKLGYDRDLRAAVLKAVGLA